MHFEAEGESPSGIQTPWSLKTKDLDPIVCAIPPEFRGPGGAYSPEDLLGLAALSCLMATFKVYSAMASLTYEKIMGSVTVTVDRPKGMPVKITQIQISLRVKDPSQREKAQQLLEETKKSCLVTNSLAIEKVYDFAVE
ncbi:MAG TPA: OsmC family protein [Rhabdochlamydiaceae bacterium]